MRQSASLHDQRGDRAFSQESQPEAASCCTEIGCEDCGVTDVALAAAQRFLFVTAIFCVCVAVSLVVKVFQ